MAGAGSGRTGPCERGRKAARGWRAGPKARDCHGAEGGRRDRIDTAEVGDLSNLEILREMVGLWGMT
jgi:hypothetical protein